QKISSSLERREKELTLQQYQRGDEISTLDSGIWQVYRGVVQLSRVQQDGTEIISGWVTANGVFGSLIDSSDIYRAVALGDVYAKRYSAHDLVKYPSLGRQFLAQFSDRLIKSQQLLAIIAISRVEDRLRHLLSMLQQEIGHTVEDGVRLQVRFTHQHLAESIHTTRVTMTRILGEFQAQGLVYFDQDRHLVIKNI
ncbi:MAG: Crp/Fnr family transcriptional regulator, partial [Cyanobacteria bacterium P01_C01_bin.72]